MLHALAIEMGSLTFPLCRTWIVASVNATMYLCKFNDLAEKSFFISIPHVQDMNVINA